MNILDRKKEELYALGDRLFRNPELGYKEYETKKILTEYFEKNGLKVEELGYRTAFRVSVGSGKPHIGLIAELDAIPTLGHPFENKKDHAAHSCGHSTQCAIMAYTLVHLKDKVKNGTVTLYFTPGEEFTDVPFRKQLIRNGEINYIGGKVNLLTGGCFDREDLFIHLHTMGQTPYHFSLNSSLAGFIYKEITFRGKASHAAVAPHNGVNALNAFVLFDNAVNMLRETFKEEDHIRIFNPAVQVRYIIKNDIIHPPLEIVAPDFLPHVRLLGRRPEDDQATARRGKVEINLIANADKEHDDQDLKQDTEEETQQVRPEENQTLIITLVNVHDLELQIGHQVSDYRAADQGGYHRLILFPSHVKPAVHSVHGDGHGGKGQQGGGQGTVDDPQEYIVDRKTQKKSNPEENIKTDRHGADQNVRFCLMR